MMVRLRFCSRRLLRRCSPVRDLLPRSDLPGAQQKTPFNVNRYVLLLVYVVGVGCTGPLFFNWPPIAELLFRNEAFAELCKKDPLTGAYTPDLRRRRPQRQPTGEEEGTDDGSSGGSEEGGKPYICDAQEAAVQQLYTLCCAVCCCFCGVAGSLMDACGPRFTTVAGRLLQVVGWVMLAFANVSSSLYYVGMAFFASGIDAVVLPTLSVCRLFPASEGLIITVVGSALSASYAVPLVMKQLAEVYGESFRMIVLRYALLCPLTFAVVALFLMPRQNFEHFPVGKEEATAGEGSRAGQGGGGGEVGGKAAAEAAAESAETHEPGDGRHWRGGREQGGRQTVDRRGEEKHEESAGRGGELEGGEGRGGEHEEISGEGTKEGRNEEEEDGEEKRKTGDRAADLWRMGTISISTRRQGRSDSNDVCARRREAATNRGAKCVREGGDRLASRLGSAEEDNIEEHCRTLGSSSGRRRMGSDGGRRGRSNSSDRDSAAETRLYVLSSSFAETRHDKKGDRSSRELRDCGAGIESHPCVLPGSDAAAAAAALEEATASSRNEQGYTADDCASRSRLPDSYRKSSAGRQADTSTDTACAAAGATFVDCSAGAVAPDAASPASVSPPAGTPVSGGTVRSAGAPAATARHSAKDEIATHPTIQAAAAGHSSLSSTTDASAIQSAVNTPAAGHPAAKLAPLRSVEALAPPGDAASTAGGAAPAACGGAAPTAHAAFFDASLDADPVSNAAVRAAGNGTAPFVGPATTAAAPAAVAPESDAAEVVALRHFRVEEVVAVAPPENEDSRAQRSMDRKTRINRDEKENNSNSNDNTQVAAGGYYEETGVVQGASRENILTTAARRRAGVIDAATSRSTAGNNCSSSATNESRSSVAVNVSSHSNAMDSESAEGSVVAGTLHGWGSSRGGTAGTAQTNAADATREITKESTAIFRGSTAAGESLSTAPDDVAPMPASAARSSAGPAEETSSPGAAGAQASLRPTLPGNKEGQFQLGRVWPRRSSNPVLQLQQLATSPRTDLAPSSSPSPQQVAAPAGGGAAAVDGAGAPLTSCGSETKQRTGSSVCTSDEESCGEEDRPGRCCSCCNRSTSCCSTAAPPSLQRTTWGDCLRRLSQNSRSRSAIQQLTSERFLLILLYKIVVVLVATYFQEASQRMFSPRVLHVRATLLPFSFLPCIALGKAADRFNIVRVLFVVNFFGFLTYFFSFFSQYGVAWAYLSVCCFVCYMSFYSSQIFIYVEETFSPEHFGKLSGFTLMTGGVISLAAHPLYSHLTVGRHGGNTLPVRVALTVPLLLLNLLLLRLLFLYRKNPQPFRTPACIDDQVAGDKDGSSGRCCGCSEKALATVEGTKQPECCRSGSSTSSRQEFAATKETAVPASSNGESPAAPIASL